MGKLILLPVLLCALAGCGTMPATDSNGGAVQDTGPVNGRAIARDVIKKLVILYPPAKTRFDLQQRVSDSFGVALVEQLRLKGYALAEFKPASVTKASPSAGGGKNATPAVLPLAYIIDQPGDTGLYRVTLTINRQSLTRAYQATAGKTSPASYWVRKE